MALLLAAVLSPCVFAAAQTSRLSDPTPLQKSPLPLPANTPASIILPFFAWQDLIIVLGTINEETIPQRFVVDTGLNACTVTSDVYSKSGLTARSNEVRFNVLDSSGQAPEVVIGSLRFPGLKLQNVPVAMSNIFGTLSHSKRPDAPTCWLGYPFLSTFQVTIDFGAHVLILNPAKAPLPAAQDAKIVPFTLKEGRIWVKVSVPGAKPFNALVDTASPGSLIPGDVAQKLKWKPIQVVPIMRGGKVGNAGLVVIPKMAVGKAEVADMRALALAPDAPPVFDRTFGILGLDFLSHFRVTIDYTHQKLMFATPETPTPDVETAEKN